jgi:Tfp pilus assembly PilM family ATPase
MLCSGPMGLLSQSALAKRRTQIVAIDMGTRTTKAVSLQRRNNGFDLLRYTIQDAPIHEKSLSTELMAEHLKNITEALGAKTKQVVLVVGVNDSLLRHAEVPMVPVGDMRLMLKFNSKNYLQQDLPDYVFDWRQAGRCRQGQPEMPRSGRRRQEAVSR